jgi:hypothetical protein
MAPGIHLDNLLDTAHMKYDSMRGIIHKLKIACRSYQDNWEYRIDQYNKNMNIYLVVLEHNLSTIIESMKSFTVFLDDYIR